MNGDDRIIGNQDPANSPLGTGMDDMGTDTTALSFGYLIGGGGNDYIVGTNGEVTENIFGGWELNDIEGT